MDTPRLNLDDNELTTLDSKRTEGTAVAHSHFERRTR
jgi:hypothetical protein